MAFHYTISVLHEVSINLLELPIDKWPEEAKILAKNFLTKPANFAKLQEQLPELRQAWLAAHVERLSVPLDLDI